MTEPVSVDEFLSFLQTTDAFTCLESTRSAPLMDALRGVLQANSDRFECYRAISGRIGAEPTVEGRRMLMAARDEYERRMLAATVASVYQAFARSTEDGWTVWLTELAAALSASHFRRCRRLCDESFPFDAPRIPIVRAWRRTVDLAHQARWEEVYDDLVFLAAQVSLPAPLRARTAAIIGGLEMWRFDDNARAQERMEEARAIASDDGVVLAYYADWLLAEKRYEEAVPYYEDAIRLAPNDANGYAGIGDRFEQDEALDETDRLTQAEWWYREAVAKAGGDTLGHERLIAVLGRPERLEKHEPEMLALAESIVVMDPEGAYDTYLDIGGYYLTAKRLTDARRWFEKAVHAEEHWPAAYVSLSRLCVADNRGKDAESYCRRAIELDADYASGHIALARLYEDQGRWLDALQVYARFPARPRQWVGYGRASTARMHVALGEYQEAETVLWGQLPLTPEDLHVRGVLEDIAADYYKRKDSPAAARVYNEMRRIIGEEYDASCHANLARMYEFLGEHEQAVAEYQKAVEAAPDEARHHRSLSVAYRAVQNWTAAERESERAYDIDKDAGARADDRARIANLHANALYAQGEYRAAIAQYRQSIAAVPGEPVYHSNLASAWKQLKEPGLRAVTLGEAIRGYQEALRLDPKGSHRELVDRLSRRKALVEAYGERVVDYEYLITPIAMELASDLVPCVTGSASGGLSAEVLADTDAMRNDIAARFGVIVPGVRYRGNAGDFTAGTYVMMINDVPLMTGRIAVTQRFCPSSPESVSALGIRSTPASDPLTRAAGSWIGIDDWPAADSASLELWSIARYMLRHLESLLLKNLDEFVGHQEIAILLDRATTTPAREIRRSSRMLTDLTKVCRAMVAEAVPIQPFDALCAAFKELHGRGLDPRHIVEEIRIVPEFREHLKGCSQGACVHLGPVLEDELRRSLYVEGDRALLAMQPERCQETLAAVRTTLPSAPTALVVNDEELRPFLRKLVELQFPELAVLSRRELPADSSLGEARTIDIASESPAGAPVFRRQQPADPASTGDLQPTPADLASMEIVVFTSREVATAPANGHESSLVDLLSTMRGELFNELGLILPDVRLEVNAGLPQDHFSIRLNGDDLPALRGLSAREFLTNDTVDRLTLLGIRGRQDVNPATGLECAIVEETDGEWFTCRQAGLTTWGTRGHISLVLSAAIRAAADRFQSDAVTQACLDAVADSFPELVRMALERYPLGDISSVLRYLLREGIAIRDLRSILEALLTLDGTTDVDLRRFIVFSANTDGLCPAGSGLAAADLKPAQLADFVRAEGLKRPLSHKYTRGFDTLTAYLLDPTIETRLAESGREPLTNEERTRLLAAVHTKVDALPNRNPFAVILTTFDIRRALRRVIEPDLPRLGVLCYQELTPTTNIQPLGRIAWS